MTHLVSRRKPGATIVGAALAAVLLTGLLGAQPAQAAAAKCPGTFRVLHNDRIGKLELPKGRYTITLIDNTKLTCPKASQLFTRFLQDWDGNLPGKWRIRVKKAQFVRGGSQVGFSVARDGGNGKGNGGKNGGGGRHPQQGQRKCPGTFEVEHNDRIGQLMLPKGPYVITRIRPKRVSCAFASRGFTKFLDHPDGKLPNRWSVHAQSASFTQAPSGRGFRVKHVG